MDNKSSYLEYAKGEFTWNFDYEITAPLGKRTPEQPLPDLIHNKFLPVSGISMKFDSGSLIDLTLLYKDKSVVSSSKTIKLKDLESKMFNNSPITKITYQNSLKGDINYIEFQDIHGETCYKAGQTNQQDSPCQSIESEGRLLIGAIVTKNEAKILQICFIWARYDDSQTTLLQFKPSKEPLIEELYRIAKGTFDSKQPSYESGITNQHRKDYTLNLGGMYGNVRISDSSRIFEKDQYSKRLNIVCEQPLPFHVIDLRILGKDSPFFREMIHKQYEKFENSKEVQFNRVRHIQGFLFKKHRRYESVCYSISNGEFYDFTCGKDYEYKDEWVSSSDFYCGYLDQKFNIWREYFDPKRN